MSQWTHVTGTIRVDTMDRYCKAKKRILEVLGLPCNFDELSTRFDSCTLPKGSEGSLQYKIIKTGEESFSNYDGKKRYGGCNMAAFTVCFWGDLRDFDENDTKKIDKWFQKVIAELSKFKKGTDIRNAVLEVDCDGITHYVLNVKFLDNSSVDFSIVKNLI